MIYEWFKEWWNKKFDTKGNIIFEGEYKEGKKWNWIERRFHSNINLIKFEGEFTNGERTGKMKRYEFYKGINHIEFEGELVKGERNGKGILYDHEGKLLNLKMIKNGKEYAKNITQKEY